MIRASEIFPTRLCPGRVKAQDGLPETTSEEAAEGVLLHDAHGDRAKAALLSPSQIEVLDGQDHALKELLSRIFFGVDIPSLRVVREEQFYASFQGRPIMSGHPDYVAIGEVSGKTVALVVDYKTGWLSNEVPAPEVNDQLRGYAVSIFQNYAVDEVYATIIQRFGKSMRPVLYDRSTLTPALEDLAQVEKDSRDLSDRRTPSLDACRYCRAKATDRCPETLRLPALFNQPINQATLGPEQWSFVLQEAARVKDLIKTLESKAKAALEADPTAIPGWKLKPGARVEVAAEPSKIYQAIQDHVSGEDFANECCEVSVPKLRDVLGRAIGWKAKERKEKTAELLGPLITYKQNAPSLVQAKLELEAA